MMRTCRACNEQYAETDDPRAIGLSKDDDWHPEDGKCYNCYLDFCFELYGGMLEPCFTVGDKQYCARGVVNDGDCSDEPIDIPF